MGATAEQLLKAKKARTKRRAVKLKKQVDKRTEYYRVRLKKAKESIARRDRLLEQAQARVDELTEKLAKHEPPAGVSVPGLTGLDPSVPGPAAEAPAAET